MTVHVVGAGLAGLAAAVQATGRGRRVRLYEGTGQAGGRCRSFFDAVLGRTIDNGNHLLLSGNRSARRFVETIGSAAELTGPPTAQFDFIDLTDRRRWRLDLGRGRLPFWLFSERARVPHTVLGDYLALARLMLAGPNQTVAQIVPDDHPLYEALVLPLAIAALNAQPTEGAAALLGAVVRETFLRGGAACRPLMAARSLDAAFIDPALAWLAGRSVRAEFNQRLRGLEFGRGRIAALRFTDGSVAVGPEDVVVLAVPPAAAAEIVPDLTVPLETRAILNAHFRVDGLPERVRPPLGLIGGLAEWIFVRGDVASTTTSAADAGMDADADDLAQRLWQDVRVALRLTGDMPRVRVIKERRATYAQTPADVARRPQPWTAWPNLFLAGDWVAGPLPATIEGAIRSGDRAAELACGVEGAEKAGDGRR
ncbi:squalene-associated FAD-dependent desaturase [Stella humosa]|uniref:Squalene-associated FAD-dependent desaturase n=1 Tax=Stella humosa TaxID=94 RepID=A0A3N1KPI7_9PROT|nr:hydroxysqualene dehydroxylase HpnE [Stella humosa]ROP81257.1 squalene-associated FAD-dependent desaturase [Stella humosa]BBK32605.1 amine oxidase [Stella humosa]